MNQGVIELPASQPILIDNATCIYCGQPFADAQAQTKEHVIGRRFVPRGSLDKQWNLIAWACSQCNGLKAALENDISAITMQPDAAGQFAAADARLHQDAKRKGERSFSRRTGRPVGKSSEQMTFKRSLLPGVSGTLSLTCPPQMDEDRAFELAKYHVGGFFYWLTFDSMTKRGRVAEGVFAPVAVACRSDWGNAQLRGFQDFIARWPIRVHGVGGAEFFKIRICRAPDDRLLWAWALEWNQSYRLVGFFGDEGGACKAADSLPGLVGMVVPDGNGGLIRYRRDQALASEEDRLFALPSELPK
jgi:hypothetical protein